MGETIFFISWPVPKKILDKKCKKMRKLFNYVDPRKILKYHHVVLAVRVNSLFLALE